MAVNWMSKIKCNDCNDTGLIEVESVTLSRPFYDKTIGGLAYQVYGHNDWHKGQCHCVGEDEDV
jgi:hypothetical protein